MNPGRTGVQAGILRLRLCPLAELRADTDLFYEQLDTRRRIRRTGRAVPAALPRMMRIEWLLAAPDVLLVNVEMPRLAGGKLRAALPGLIEPALLGDLESAFVAASGRDGSGRATLAAVDRALLRRAIELFARLGMHPDSATPEPLALELPPAGGWSVRTGEIYGCVRTGATSGFACAGSTGSEPPVELRLALGQAAGTLPAVIEVEGPCDAAAWSAALGAPVKAARSGDTAPRVELEILQEEFAPRIADWRAWRMSAALAAAWAAVWIAGANADAWMMAREERVLRERMTAMFRETFPQVTAVLDPWAQMRRGLGELRSSAGTGDPADFVALATAFARAAQLDTEAVQEIEYRDGTLRVRFGPRALDAGQRDALGEKLRQAGLGARFADATLTVRRGAAP